MQALRSSGQLLVHVPPNWVYNNVTHKNPTAMIPPMATFFLIDIWSFAIRGKGIIRRMKSFNMFSIPAAMKNLATSRQVPVTVPPN